MVWRVRVEELETIGGAAYRVARASRTIQPDAVCSCFYLFTREQEWKVLSFHEIQFHLSTEHRMPSPQPRPSHVHSQGWHQLRFVHR